MKRQLSVLAISAVCVVVLSSCGASDYEKARMAECEQLAFTHDQATPLTAKDVSNLSTKYTKISDTLGTVLVEFSEYFLPDVGQNVRHQCSVDGFEVSTEFSDIEFFTYKPSNQ